MLTGTKVISFNHFLMGPICAQILGDLGADVIAIEPVYGSYQRNYGRENQELDGQTMLYLAGGRNKRCLALDLKSDEGKAIVRKLISTADVVTENYRPGVMERLGFDYEAVRSIRPDVVYASGTGYGLDGPHVDLPGQDLLVQAMSGMAKITGRNGEARPIGTSAIDMHGGALLALGVMAALLRRGRTGSGCRVDTSLLGAAIDLQLESFTYYLNGIRPRSVEAVEQVAGWFFPSPYGVYRTLDRELVLSVAPLPALAEVFDEPELAAMANGDEFAQRGRISRLVASHLARRPFAQWAALFDKNGIWYTSVNDYEAVVVDPQVIANRHFQKMPGATGSDVHLVSHPVNYDGKLPEVRLPPQSLGAQTREILYELGYHDPEIDSLIAREVIVDGLAELPGPQREQHG